MTIDTNVLLLSHSANNNAYLIKANSIPKTGMRGVLYKIHLLATKEYDVKYGC